MAKVGANIRASQKNSGLVEDREKRQNHKQKKAAELLAVPRYADLVEEGGDDGDEKDGTGESKSSLVKSSQGWRKEMAKWVCKEQQQSNNELDDGLLDTVYGRQRSKWLPRSLDLLFGGQKEADSDMDEQMRRVKRRHAYTEEARLMELLADEEGDDERILDDGELEGSGDDFEV
ncbi:hypothetical protein C0992_008318 [Termitomyces sp. T32_za158]|nr:hypothetical protein C0992_008318 [Termitomyces sp. T32_za158]